MKTGTSLLLLLCLPLLGNAAEPSSPRREINLDKNWRWSKANPADAASPLLNDRNWQPVQLPHDWSIEGRVSILEPSAGHGGFFPTGAAWYRRDLDVPSEWAGKQITLRFDGITMNAELWLDGRQVVYHPYGYTPLLVDLSSQLKPGSTHKLVVRVDNSKQPNTRWYTGSGIYRHAWIVVTEPLCVAPWGLVARTLSADDNRAELEVETQVLNKTNTQEQATLTQSLYNSTGHVLAEKKLNLVLPANGEAQLKQVLIIAKPALWTPERPVLHTLITRIQRGGKTVDEVKTTVGLRTVTTSAERGFELNGKRVVLNGGNMHHDNGPLGAIALDRAEVRKVELLKAAGFNAVRTSHNPPSPAFLDACDRLGLLVMDESFDGWEKKKNKQDYGKYFKDWWKRDLDAMILRDRNHPSVVIWSIGNEVYERGTPEGYTIAANLAGRIRELDTTRPVTAGINNVPGNWEATDGLFASLDIAGYNYETARHVADHSRLPKRVIALTESYQNEAFANWAAATDFNYVIGDFVWSAVDYLGESGIGRVYQAGESATDHWVSDQFPWHGASCGDIDLTGWRKPSSHYRNIVWDAGEKLYAAVRIPTPSDKPWALTKWSMPPALPTWSWPHMEGRTLQVEVFSRHPRIRVWLNGKLAGEADTGRAQEFKALIPVKWEAGDLVIQGLGQDGTIAETQKLSCAGPAVGLRLSADRNLLKADGTDLSFVTVELVDQASQWQPHEDLPITYSVEGPASIAGIGSGDLSNPESYRDNPRRSAQGRALLVLRSLEKKGKIILRASAPGLKATELVLRSE